MFFLPLLDKIIKISSDRITPFSDDIQSREKLQFLKPFTKLPATSPDPLGSF